MNQRSYFQSRSRASVLPLAFLLGVALAAKLGQLPAALAGLYLLMSVVTFVVYALDKSAARKRQWRTPETSLHTLALLGGWPGAWLGQIWLRHKSSKPAFRRVFWLSVAINLALAGWIIFSGDTALLQRLISTLAA